MTQAFPTTSEGKVVVDGYTFEPFDLVRLLRTVFDLDDEVSFGVFVDLADPRQVKDLAYLDRPAHAAQHHAYDTLFKGIEANREALRAKDVAFYAYEEVGSSNLDLPETVFTVPGEELSLREALGRHGIVLFMGRWSATAPVTALAKEMGLRGATMHGANDRVLTTGLAVDYEEVSARAERLRKAMTKADSMRMEWNVAGKRISLDVHLGGQEAQKSHGLVRTTGDVANLPAGEVYYVPTGAEGLMPMKFEDDAGTVAVFDVFERGITGLRELVQGDEKVVKDFLEVVRVDPNAGQITELGLGTQSLPWAHTDIQDEKILGTAHLATGRSDHLGGDIDSSSFHDKRNAAHNDVLYTPEKTPEVELARVTMIRDGVETVILEGYEPSAFIKAHL